MGENIFWVDLPENTKYRKVVTENRRVGIVYSDEETDLSSEEYADVKIPKPKELVGGTEVYKKEGIPYWYCKIKNGRDEFMHIYMEDLTEEDLIYDYKTRELRKFVTKRQKQFKANVLEALSNKPKEGYRWIPVFEPSSDGNGGMKFVKGEKPLFGFGNDRDRSEKMNEYSPENESGRCSKATYFLLLLRWLKDGVATLEQLADDSTDIGHYYKSKGSKNDFELTGDRMFGGLYGFVGNTYKIIGELYEGFCVGGCYFSNGTISASDLCKIEDTLGNYIYFCVGLMELKK